MTRTRRTIRMTLSAGVGLMLALGTGCSGGGSRGYSFGGDAGWETRGPGWAGDMDSAARAEPWLWRQPDPDGQQAWAQGSHDPSVSVFSPIPEGVYADLGARRDDQMGMRTSEAIPNRLGWPTESRPDLRRERRFRSTRQADQWTYPTRGGDRYNGYHRRGGWRYD